MSARTIGRDLGRAYVEVTAQERDDSGTLSAGFTVTYSLWEARGERGPNGRAVKASGADMSACGSDPAVILAVAPELAPIVAVHLADPDGTPMHAEVNGWYFYSGASAAYELDHYGPAYVERMGSDHDRAARALHVAPADLPTDLDRDAFRAFAAALADTWQAQADAARAALDAMTDGEGVS